MMNDFTTKWDEISEKGYSAGKFRVAPDHLLDLFICYSVYGRREFILESIDPVFNDSELPEFENLDVQVTENTNGYSLVIELTDNTLNDLFSAISMDLVEASSRASTVAGAAQIFTSRLGRWSELLKERRAKGMTFAEQLGLVGELQLVSWLLQDKRAVASTIIRGWRGPDGDTRDLALGGLTIEVKAQLSSSKAALKISSLDQLDTDDRELAMTLHRFSPSENGISLASLSDQISQFVGDDHGVLTEFQRKLFLTGFDPAASYGSLAYNLDSLTIYRVQEDFPRLVPGNVPPAIRRASYEIDCDGISSYVISPEELMEQIYGKD